MSRFDAFIGLIKSVFSLSWSLPVGVGRGLESGPGPWEDRLSTTYSDRNRKSFCCLGFSFDVLPAAFIGNLPGIMC